MWQPATINQPVRHARPMLSLAKVAPGDREEGAATFMTETFPGLPVSVAV
jgi:hypothetical protein